MKVKLLTSTKSQDIKRRTQIVAAAGRLSRFPGTVTEVFGTYQEFEDNKKFAKAVIKMGHKSIVEHDYLVFAIENVTPVVEQWLIENRLTSFTIKSRREVDFRNAGFYLPKFRDKDGNIHPKNTKLRAKYKKHVMELFDKYGYYIDNDVPREDARYLLPYCFYSNIVMGMDTRELEKITKHLLYGVASKIEELHMLGVEFKEIIEKYVPYLKNSLERGQDENLEVDYLNFLDNYISLKDTALIEDVKLINYTPNPDKVIVKSALMNRYQVSDKEVSKLLKTLDQEVILKTIKEISKKSRQREFEQVNFQFEIPISLAVLTHITRHRMHSLMVPSFTPVWNLGNYMLPDSVKEFDEKTFHYCFKKNKQLYEEFKNEGVCEEDLVYFYLSGNMCNIVTNFNIRGLEWVSRMRCCNKAQWEIRNIANKMVKEVEKVCPSIATILGPTCKVFGVCNEGKESCRNKPAQKLKIGTIHHG